LDQNPHLGLDEGSAGPSTVALPSPVQPPSEPVPADDSVGMDNGQVTPPIPEDPGKQNPERAIGGSEPWPSRSPLQDLELLSQGEVLEGQMSTGA
jgi:hypothetical protein